MKDDASGPSSDTLYVKQITNTTFLTKEEEAELGEHILKQDAGSDLAKQKLVAAHVRLARAAAWRIWSRPENRNRRELEDLTQIANEALMRAAQTFDYRQASFATHATNWIKALIREELITGDSIRIPLSAHNRVSEIRKAVRNFNVENGRQPNAEELAKLTGLSTKQIETAMKTGRFNITSLDNPLDGDTTRTLGDLVPDEAALTPEDAGVWRDELKREKAELAELFERVRTLSPARSRAFFAVFGPSPESNVHASSTEVASELGLTRQAVSLYLREIWKKLGYEEKFGFDDDPVTSARERIARLQAVLDSMETSPPVRQQGRIR